MTNFRDPATILMDEFTVLKFWHVVDGIFIWEFVTNLGFEWSVIQGRRPYKWTIWIYSLTRMAGLATVIMNLILLNTTAIINCQVSAILEMLPAYLALSSASLLLVLRTIAIWKKNTAVVVIAAIIWVVNGAFLILGISRLRDRWDDSIGSCETPNFEATKVTMIIAFATDVLLLIIMLVGLFRLGCHRHGPMVMGRFLWNQGVIWLFLATVAGIIPTVLVCLNLNDAFSMMFQIPWLITMSIAATWMYRSLHNLSSSDIRCSAAPYEVPHNSGSRIIPISGMQSTAPVTILPNRVGVEVSTSHEWGLTSQLSDNSIPRSADRLVPHGFV